MTAFCRDDAASAAKIRATTPDVMEVRYYDLLTEYQATMDAVFAFVELPDAPVRARPGRRRLPNRPVRDRVANWAELVATVPRDVREKMESEDLV